MNQPDVNSFVRRLRARAPVRLARSWLVGAVSGIGSMQHLVWYYSVVALLRHPWARSLGVAR